MPIWLTIILAIIQYGPAVIKLIREIWALIQDIDDPQEAKHYKSELRNCLQKHRKTKAKEPLVDLRNELRARANGNV